MRLTLEKPKPLTQRGLQRRQQAGGELRVEHIEGFLADGDRAVLRDADGGNRRQGAERRDAVGVLARQHRLAAVGDAVDEAAERRDQRQDLILCITRGIRGEVDAAARRSARRRVIVMSALP